jgi:predicted ATPase/DNA-binding winged helix-turn-helix (wHTH) protein
MPRAADSHSDVIHFGRFAVVEHRRELLVDGRPVALGGRAFDLLMALIDGRGKLMSTDELMNRVWPGRVVEENSLHSHMSTLRRALAADKGIIRTVPGRGYQFTAECSTGVERDVPSERASSNLPERVSELFGRDADLFEVADLVRTRRLVTLVGVGGIGKTRLAMDVGRSLLPRFGAGVWLAELAPLSDPELVAARVASALGVTALAGTATPERIAAALGGRHLLLVLDNCEHLIDMAARIAEGLLLGCPQVSVLATSREPLLVDGEYVYRVPPLEVPPDDSVDAVRALQTGALRMFAARVRAAQPGFTPDHAFARRAAFICRRLDGIPLAIELAAARSTALGIDALAERLDDRFTLLSGGRRTALPRHQTLRATFDWSYDLLLPDEQVVLRRLSVFAGSFSLEFAVGVAGDSVAASIAPASIATSSTQTSSTQTLLTQIAAGDVPNHLASLVSKSLVVAEQSPGRVQYRLLETVRAYGLEKLAAADELQRLARQHASSHLATMESRDGEPATPTLAWLSLQAAQIDNLRAALDWATSDPGDAQIAERLTVAAVPLWMHLSLVDECRRRAQRVFASGAAARNESPEKSAEESQEKSPEKAEREMRLLAAQGAALVYTSMGPQARVAWERALAIADRLGDVDYQLRSLWGLWVDRLNGGRFRESLSIAERFLECSASSSDPNERWMGHRLVGVSLHFLGELAQAEEHLQRMLDHYVVPPDHLDVLRFQFDPVLTARCFHARVRWLRGHADEALAIVEQVVIDATAQGHALSLINSLGQGACLVALYSGDLATARRYLDLLLDFSTRHDIQLWHQWARCFEGALTVREGQVDKGLKLLRAAFTANPETRRLPRYLALLGELAHALTQAGEYREGLTTIDEALLRSESVEERWCLPELLRLKGDILLAMDNAAAGVALYKRSIELAQMQGAVAWEMRAVKSLSATSKVPTKTKRRAKEVDLP